MMADGDTHNGNGDGNSGLIARMGSKVRKYADAAKTAQRERDEYKAQNEKMSAELAQLRPRLDNSATLKEIDRLKAEIRTRDHRVRFDALARAAKIRPDALDDLWSLSGYKAEAEEVDETVLSALIEEQRSKRPFLFDASAPAPPAPKPGPAAGRGAPNGPGAPPVSEELLNDPVWVMKNYDQVVAGAKAGTIR